VVFGGDIVTAKYQLEVEIIVQKIHNLLHVFYCDI